jgi:predicted DNA-binding transcriptional regulator AlpA
MSVSSVQQEYLTTDEAAQLCGFTRAAFNQRRLRGDGPPYIKVGPRCIRYKRRDVLTWLDSRARPAATAVQS